MQKYVADPMTVGGKKFDMRIYVLVTSWSPLEVWLHRDGFCRFSTARFESAWSLFTIFLTKTRSSCACVSLLRIDKCFTTGAGTPHERKI